jgi:uncharacterized membrane protein
MSYTNPLAQKIYSLLAPLIGPLMAESAVRLQSKKAGVTPETITLDNLSLIAQEIEKAIRIFVGSDKAREIAAVIANVHSTAGVG